MNNKLDGLIKNSVTKKNEQKLDEQSLADKIRRNADLVMGVEDEPAPRRGSIIKNLTFTFGIEEVAAIDEQIERFLKHGKHVSKSELIRIGLKLIERTENREISNLTALIVKHPRGRQK